MLALSRVHLMADMSFCCTPEYLAHKAELIFVGVPQRAEITHLVGDRWLTTVQFRIDKRIKGPLSASDLVTVRNIDWAGKTDQMDLAGAVGKKRGVLVMATPAKNSFPETDGLYRFLEYFWNRQVFYTDEPVKWIYTEAGASILAYADLLNSIEAQVTKEAALVRRSWPGKIVVRRIVAGRRSDAHQQLVSTGSVFILAIEYKEPETPLSEKE